MAKSVVLNHTDTPISGNPTPKLTRGLVNYAADFTVKSMTPEDVVITNLTSPVPYPEKFQFGSSEVSDVYKGAGIDPSLYAPSRRGVSLFAKNTSIWTVVDSVDTTYQVALPVSCHVVIRVPNNELITPAMVDALLGRTISAFYETGTEATTRIGALLRGSLLPSDLK